MPGKLAMNRVTFLALLFFTIRWHLNRYHKKSSSDRHCLFCFPLIVTLCHENLVCISDFFYFQADLYSDVIIMCQM